MHALRASVAADILTTRKELSELEARLRRVEQHLNLPSLGAT